MAAAEAVRSTVVIRILWPWMRDVTSSGGMPSFCV